MGVVDNIVQQERDRKKREDEKRRREDAAFNVVMALPDDGRRSVLVRLIDAEEAVGQAVKPETPTPAPVKNGRKETYVDRAENAVLTHPEGMKTRDIGKAIGQDVKSVDGTLRQAAKRGNIYYDKATRKWWPTTAKAKANGPPPKPKRVTIRDLIYRAYAAEKGPLGAMRLYEALQKFQPDINRTSVDGEINRMKKDKLLVQVGVGENNGGLYTLANGGGNAANAN